MKWFRKFMVVLRLNWTVAMKHWKLIPLFSFDKNRKYKYKTKWICVNVTCCLCSKCQRIISNYESDIKTRFKSMETRFKSMETRFKSMETRFKSMETTKHKQQPWKKITTLNKKDRVEHNTRLPLPLPSQTWLSTSVTLGLPTITLAITIGALRSHTVIDWF